MNNFHRNAYSKLIIKASSIVMIIDNICALINFNQYFRITNFEKKLNKCAQATIDEFMDNLSGIKGDHSTYIKGFQKQFEEALSLFIVHDEYLIHKNLLIIDDKENKLAFDDLSMHVKQSISSFVSVQKSSLLCFLSKLGDDQKLPLPLGMKWNGTKTDLVELVTALHEGGFITIENGASSKKEIMKKFADIFNIDIAYYKGLISKAMVRENSATFTNRLNDVLSDFYNNLID
jgi:hypothetical protein